MSTQLIQALEDSREEFLAAAAGVSEQQAKIKPAPDKWSVLDCVEHITTSEGRFLSWLENPVSEPAPPQDQQKEAMLAERLPSRATKAQAPEASHPKGRFATLAEAHAEFQNARGRSIQFAQERGAGLYSLAARHPFFGLINGGELMVMIAGHCRRHAAQIREIKDQLASSS